MSLLPNPVRTNILQHHIDIEPGNKPRNSAPYRYAAARRKKSPWASPVVLAPKKDGTVRFCIEYRKLNETTIRDHVQFPSTLDLRSDYRQVEMDKESKPLIPFVTEKGLFELYLDDIIVYSRTFEQHLQDLKKVFLALADANITLKSSKCNFCRPKMKYLGHIITPGGIKPDPDLISTMTKFTQPTKTKEVQAFLGLTGYYRHFIENYAKIAEPLIKLLRTTQSTTLRSSLPWNDDYIMAFNALKQRLISSPIMRLLGGSLRESLRFISPVYIKRNTNMYIREKKRESKKEITFC
ncbi:unnamed protein product [Adineta ricciae]|uniref:Reverse transcriptase domain-containing protein n=1 Tax=Adineta ricciae TaxID=249248 RepID=A0A814CDF0_ADIRI|nr:unnamed protein product [Adineta ricciae]CAF1490857.1 unnamed protein product [Adineta ricciae]